MLGSRGQVQLRQSTRHVFRLRAEQCNGKLRPRRRILHAPQPVKDLLQPFTGSRATLSELTRHLLVPEADLLERIPSVLVAKVLHSDREFLEGVRDLVRVERATLEALRQQANRVLRGQAKVTEMGRVLHESVEQVVRGVGAVLIARHEHIKGLLRIPSQAGLDELPRRTRRGRDIRLHDLTDARQRRDDSLHVALDAVPVDEALLQSNPRRVEVVGNRGSPRVRVRLASRTAEPRRRGLIETSLGREQVPLRLDSQSLLDAKDDAARNGCARANHSASDGDRTERLNDAGHHVRPGLVAGFLTGLAAEAGDLLLRL